MVGTTIRYSERSKLEIDEGPVPVLLVGSFEVDRDVKLEDTGRGEGDKLGILEVTGVGNKIGISDGEVMGITLVTAVVQRQAEGVGKRAQDKLSAQGNYKTRRARD